MTITAALKKWKQETQKYKFKVLLNYIENLRSALATWDPASSSERVKNELH